MKKSLLFLLFFIVAISNSIGQQQFKNVVPNKAHEGSIGTSNKPWRAGYFDLICIDGYNIDVTNRLSTTNILISNMGYEDIINIPGIVNGIYDTSPVESDNSFYFISNNLDQIEFESWKGNVNTLTTTSTNDGYLDSSLLSFITNKSACLIINSNSYWIESVMGGTNIIFSPLLEPNIVYDIEDIRSVELKNLGLYNGIQTEHNNAPWIGLVNCGVMDWRGVSSHDGITVYACVYGNYIYKSTDGGISWTALTSAGSRNW